MPTIQVGPGSGLELQKIADTLGNSRKVVVITGAGISTNCGIPDFRSEDGLYSLIQAQYDAALKNPPWEQSNTFDIDDRPKKKRKQWYYEIVAPDGRVVGEIDEELDSQQPSAEENEPRRSSRSRSTNTTNSNSRSSTPSVKSSDDSSLSSCPSEIFEVSFAPTNGDASIFAEDKPSPRRNSQNSLSDHVSEDTSAIASNTSTITRKSTRRSLHQSESQSTSATSSAPNSRPPSRSSYNRSSSDTITPVTEHITESSTVPSNSRIYSLQREESSFLSTSSETSNPQSSQSSSRSLPNLKGRDLFDSMIWQDPQKTSIHYMFISSLRQKVQKVGTTTETHKFLRILRDGGRLVRNYTQNIDLLEEREGLCADLLQGTGNKSRFNPKIQREKRPEVIDRDGNNYGGCEVVPLHGTLSRLRCPLCKQYSSWDDEANFSATLSGTAPDCPSCTDYHAKRTSNGRRGFAIGRLRPDIVLYGEEHPNANLIGPLITHDLNLGPDVLLIVGTSLKVHGLKVMIREFAKAVHTKGGKVIFINRTKPPESTWGDVIDYWVEWDCDAWVLDLKRRRGDIWLPQGTAVEEPKRRQSVKETKQPPESRPTVAPKQTTANTTRPQCIRDDKVNGVYLTFKILDTLGNFPDADGNTATRFTYWKATSRRSTITHISSEPPKKPQPTKKAPRKSLPAASTQKPAAATKAKSNKRKSYPSCLDDDKENVAYIVTDLWKRLREIAPGLPEPPPELRHPFSAFSSNKPSYLTPFAFDATSNHLPNVGSWPLDKMNLVTHPPSGPSIPALTAKAEERHAVSHTYSTRASRRWNTAESIVVDSGRTSLSSETSDIIVVDGPSRIKRMSSINNIVSEVSDDSDEIWHDAPEVMT